MNDGLFLQNDDGGIKIVHLVSGEDILGKITLRTDELGRKIEVVIDKPVLPQVMTDNGKHFRVGLMPYRPYLSEDPLVVVRDKVVFIATVNEQMAKLYQQFTSDIILATESDLPAQPLR